MTMKPINVLYVFGDRLRHGGIEIFMMNYFKHMDQNVVHIDFVILGELRGVFDDEIENAGSIIYRLPKPGRHIFRYNREFMKILKSGKYQIIHAHSDAMNYRILRLAKECNVPVRIAHSHNVQHILSGISRLKTPYYEYSRKRIVDYASVCFACSEDAGRWLYGNHHFEIIPNAIDIDKFLFHAEKRKMLREKYGISQNVIVLGHVGRFDVQKNQIFLVRLLKKLSEDGNKKFRLLMVGDGWKRKDIVKKVHDYKLEELVMFTGEVDNTQDYYNMMDIFLMPSLFEGYGMALEEAEVNGLPCIASKYIPREVNILDHIEYVQLDLSIWYKKVINYLPKKRYQDAAKELKRKGYEINWAAQKLQNEYLRLHREVIGDKNV